MNEKIYLMEMRNKLDIIPQESKNISYEKNIKPEI